MRRTLSVSAICLLFALTGATTSLAMGRAKEAEKPACCGKCGGGEKKACTKCPEGQCKCEGAKKEACTKCPEGQCKCEGAKETAGSK